jgi:hypothetical protein
MGDRLIQFGSIIALAGAIAGAAVTQPKLVEVADRDELRYTDISIDGAPPIVAVGTAIGALRGLIVDYLWIKVTLQKENGLRSAFSSLKSFMVGALISELVLCHGYNFRKIVGIHHKHLATLRQMGEDRFGRFHF